MKIVSTCIQKGGVGKTTTTINLAVALLQMGKRVLMVDADPQANLSGSILGDGERPQSLSDLIYSTVAGLPYTPEQFIGSRGGLDVVVSSKLLAGATTTLSMASDSDAILSRAISNLTHAGADYDFVLIDCAPCLDLLVTNCLVASDGVLIPMEPAKYSVDGIVDVYGTITRIQNTTNPRLRIERIIINKFDTRKKDHHTYMAEIREAFPELVYPTPIPWLTEVEHSATNCFSMSRTKKSKAWPLYRDIAEGLIYGTGS